MPRYIDCAYYLDKALDPKCLKRMVMLAVRNLRGKRFDAIAFRGLSGALVAPIIAYKLNKSLIVVRKNEKRHSSRDVEGDRGARRYIILDDFISTGKTVKTVLKEVTAWSKVRAGKSQAPAKCVGVYLTDHPRRGLMSFEDAILWSD